MIKIEKELLAPFFISNKMKTLYIVRHAKSSWGSMDISDFDRSLNSRGKEDVPFMGIKLKELKVQPDYVISSPAKRAITTAKGLSEGLGFPITRIDEHANTYESSAEEMLKSIRSISDDVKELMIVGHNPSVSYLVSYLTDEYLTKYSTCGCYAVELDITSWEDISKGKKKFWVYPKYFKS
jgi:phosphohistidine phosphatase